MATDSIHRRVLAVVVVSMAACSASTKGTSAVGEVTIRPVETQAVLPNPGIGWQTDGPGGPSVVPSGATVLRLSWLDLEPSDGAVDLTALRRLLGVARAKGQSVMFRLSLASHAGPRSPAWLASAGCAMISYRWNGGPLYQIPDLDDPVCFARHGALLRALGAELSDEPGLQVDIGSVGMWGEWHFAGTREEGTGEAVAMPTLETRRRIIDAYFEAFAGRPLAMQIGDVESLAYAVARGAGWRADCLGDYGFGSSTWNHMDDMYRQNVMAAHAEDAWKRGPVAWESCYDMEAWVEHGFDVHAIFQYALDLHGSVLHNGVGVPDGHQDEIEEFVRKLGYRFVLRELTHPAVVETAGPLRIAMRWENVGVAPCYEDYRLALRIGSGATAVVLPAATDVCSWLPGPREVSASLTLPSSLAAGEHPVAVAVLDASGSPVVRLAIEGRAADGWYPLSAVRVVAR